MRPGLGRGSRACARGDFFLGYSPERINPGDREHRLERITKVVAGQTPRSPSAWPRSTAGSPAARSISPLDIRTAEAAKAIENAQRDINIAFVNEVAMICDRLGLSVHDVLEAAGTKWNFLDFTPGLVGGHCIGVDPYYLAHKAESGRPPSPDHPGRARGQRRDAGLRRRLSRRCLAPGRGSWRSA